MFAQVHYPDQLAPRDLDRYLEAGWFRMGQSIFTTNFLHFKNQFYSAVWLRIPLSDFEKDRTQEKLFKRNKAFRIEIKKAVLDIAKEELFARYKQAISFDTSPSLYHLLNGKLFYNLFDTREINLYDGDTLVATGFFDVGERTAAGITSFYNPDYKKFSPGKYLIYLKMHWCRDQGLDFFYPGYFVPGYSFFNYKLDLGREALQYLDLKTGTWKPIAEFTESLYQIMERRLLGLQAALQRAGIEARLFKYEFFDAGLFPELKDATLFDFPVFVNCFSFRGQEINPFVVYDVRDEKFHLVQCSSLWTSNLPSPDENVYAYHLLAPDHELFATSETDDMARFITAIPRSYF